MLRPSTWLRSHFKYSRDRVALDLVSLWSIAPPLHVEATWDYSHFHPVRDVKESLLPSSCPFPWCYGTEFASKAMDHWAYLNGVHLDFIRAGRPVENGYIESFNGRLRDECLNVEVFFSLTDARSKLAIWLHDYNHHRPHSALADRTPAEFADICSGGNDGDEAALENASRFPHFPRTTAAGRDLTCAPVSSLLLETIT